MKELNICWNVYNESICTQELGLFNIFEHMGFLSDCAKTLKKYKEDKEKAEELIKRDLKYYFWSKCEYEVLICAFIDPRDKIQPLKVDAYKQIENNWDIFFNYVWEHKKEIIKLGTPKKKSSRTKTPDTGA